MKCLDANLVMDLAWYSNGILKLLRRKKIIIMWRNRPQKTHTKSVMIIK